MTIDREQLTLLKTLACCKESRRRRGMLTAGGRRLQKAIREVCFNLLKGNIKLAPRQLVKLRRYKRQIRALALKKTTLKKRIVLNQKGGFLQALLPIAISTLSSLLSGGLSRR